MKNGLSGSIINELEVLEKNWQERLEAIKILNEIKSRKVKKSITTKKNGIIITYNKVK